MRNFTKTEIKKLKKYWKQLQILQNDFNFAVEILEDKMQREMKIEDLEFFHCDGYCGIGNTSRTIKLIHEEKLGKRNEI